MESYTDKATYLAAQKLLNRIKQNHNRKEILQDGADVCYVKTAGIIWIGGE